MATIQIPKLKLIRTGVSLDSVTHVGPQAELTRITFEEDQVYPVMDKGEDGTLQSRVIQCSTDEVFLWGSVEEWDEYVEAAKARAEEAMARRQQQVQQAQAAGLVVPRIVPGGNLR